MVLIISTQHRESLVSTDGKKIPEVILFFNETKGGNETIFQVIGTYTCRMATRVPELLSSQGVEWKFCEENKRKWGKNGN